MEEKASTRPAVAWFASVLHRAGKPGEVPGRTFRRGRWQDPPIVRSDGLSETWHEDRWSKALYYLLSETVFVTYMVTSRRTFTGRASSRWAHRHSISKRFLGRCQSSIRGDNSMLMLLYGVATVLLVVWFLATYFWNVSSAVQAQELRQKGKPLPSLQDRGAGVPGCEVPCHADVPSCHRPSAVHGAASLVHDPDRVHQLRQFAPAARDRLFHWTGLYSFKGLFSNSGVLGSTFWPVLGWTLTWAVVATATNYLLGMLLAILINRKGVRFKGLFRTVFVTVDRHTAVRLSAHHEEHARRLRTHQRDPAAMGTDQKLRAVSDQRHVRKAECPGRQSLGRHPLQHADHEAESCSASRRNSMRPP